VSDELDILKSVTARLASAGIPYMVTGSMAARCNDVRNLLRSVHGLDTVYLNRWAERLGLSALYREVMK